MAVDVGLVPRRGEASGVSEVVEKIGFGPGQLLTVLVACGPFLAEGLELLLISLLVHSISSDVFSENVSEGFLISVVFGGATFGNLLAGPLADLGGRQYPIIVGYAFMIFFSVTSSFMNSMMSIATHRFFVGLGFGVAQPASIVLMNEITPRKWRLVSTACSSIFFGLGVLLAVMMVMLEDAWIKDVTMLQWRLLLRLASVPMIALGLTSVVLLPESPVYLAANGDYALARDSLHALAAKNGKIEMSVAFRCPEGELPCWQLPALGQFAQLLSCPTALSTLTVGAGSFVLNFALYGSSYVVPQVVTQVLDQTYLKLAPASVLLLAFTMAFLFMITGLIWSNRVSRKTGIIACLILSLASAFAFNMATSAGIREHLFLRVLLVLACLGLCAGPAFATLLLIQASMDMYPALSSATAVAGCLAVGRLGSVIAPIVFDSLQATLGSWQPFFILLAAMELVLAMVLVPLDISHTRLPVLSQKEREVAA